ncbi:MAG: indolepyruvate oxidoreductase subunit beta [Candidatus Heimdallarchaeota archaeon]
MTDPLNIVIAGVGGQGNIVAARVLAAAAVREGMFATVGETYGASQRGGSVTSQVRLSATREYGPLIPANRGHVVVGFEPSETARVIPILANAHTEIIVNDRPVYPVSVLVGDSEYPAVEELVARMGALVAKVRCIPATEMAKEAGDAKAMNMVMIGALVGTGRVPVKEETFSTVFEELFQGKALEVNKKAFRLGMIALGTHKG